MVDPVTIRPAGVLTSSVAMNDCASELRMGLICALQRFYAQTRFHIGSLSDTDRLVVEAVEDDRHIQLAVAPFDLSNVGNTLMAQSLFVWD